MRIRFIFVGKHSKKSHLVNCFHSSAFVVRIFFNDIYVYIVDASFKRQMTAVTQTTSRQSVILNVSQRNCFFFFRSIADNARCTEKVPNIIYKQTNMSNFESFSEDLIPRVVPQPILHPVLVSSTIFAKCVENCANDG